jgi:hypothetical protein
MGYGVWGGFVPQHPNTPTPQHPIKLERLIFHSAEVSLFKEIT